MSRLADAIASGKFLVTAEIAPPKGVNISKAVEDAMLLSRWVSGMNVTDQQASIMRMAPLALCRILKDKGVEPIMQMTCRDRNRIALQSDLLGAAALGIENVLCLTGDPTGTGDHPDAKPVFDVDVVTLIRAASTLQAGTDLAGNKLDGAPQFLLGCVATPGATPLEPELVKLEKKVQAGARFVQTQAVYDLAEFERFMAFAKKLNVAVLGGIILLKSGNQARFMTKNIPGVRVPDALVQEMDAAPNKVEACVSIASRTIKALRGMCQGAHIMAIGWERHVPAVVEAAGLAPAPAV